MERITNELDLTFGLTDDELTERFRQALFYIYMITRWTRSESCRMS